VQTAFPIGSFKKCGRCNLVSYCDATCQKFDWPNHKKSCSTPHPALYKEVQDWIKINLGVELYKVLFFRLIGVADIAKSKLLIVLHLIQGRIQILQIAVRSTELGSHTSRTQGLVEIKFPQECANRSAESDVQSLFLIGKQAESYSIREDLGKGGLCQFVMGKINYGKDSL